MIRSLMKSCAICVISSTAMAQTGSATFDMPWSSKVVVVASLIPLRATVGGVAEITGQAQAIGLAFSPTPTVINVIFPGQKSSPMTIVGFRVKGVVTASWKMPLQPDQMISPPIVVPAGKPLFVRMDYEPTSPTGKFSWAPDFATLNPAAPPIVITPQPVPVPALPPLPPVGVLATAEGTWVLAAPDPQCEGGVKPAVQLNGVSKGAADEIRVCSGVLYARDGVTWYQGSAASTCGGSGWIRQTPPC